MEKVILNCPQCNAPRVFARKYEAKRFPNSVCRKCAGKSRSQRMTGCIPHNKGKSLSTEWKRKLSVAHKGKTVTDETKRKLRVSAIEQHRENGKDFPAIDAGAKDFFQYLNMFYGLNIQYPNVEIKALGYFLDGYDNVSKSAYEYDSKHHLIPAVKEKDLIRQKQIIQYFETIGRSLEHFYRIDATRVGSFGIKDVLSNI